MLIVRWILASAAVVLLASRPRSRTAAAALVAIAGVEVALGASLAPLTRTVAPLAAFLTAALTLAALARRSGLSDRAARALLAGARGRTPLLYLYTCLACVALTATVSLDGAVVLMVPLLLAIADHARLSPRPFFLGAVAVANASSLAFPQGNPTNLVLIERLGLSPAGFTTRMLVPGLAAAVVCGAAIAWVERRAVPDRYAPCVRVTTPLSSAERHAALSLAIAGLAAWTAPLLGMAPWWPFTGAVVLAVATSQPRPPVAFPGRITAQVGALAVIATSVPLMPASAPRGLLGILAVVAVAALAAAAVNNLPASIWAATLLRGPSGYAAAIGLAIGPLATPQGSVASLIAGDLAGTRAPRLARRALSVIAAGALAVATALLVAGL